MTCSISNEDLLKHVMRITTFPDVLDPRLWLKLRLKPDVRCSIVNLVTHLLSKLHQGEEVWVDSIELLGSMASYEYDDTSDIDIHVMLNTTLDPDVLESALPRFNKFIRSYIADITLHKAPLEIFFYLHSPNNRPDLGRYSVSRDAWMVHPNKHKNTFDRCRMLQDARRFIDQYNAAMSTQSMAALHVLKMDLKAYRERELDLGLGYRSTSNLTYRLLRRLNILDALRAALENDDATHKKINV